MADQKQNPRPAAGKKLGNPNLRRLKEQNEDLAASNKKLRQELESFRNNLKVQRNKAKSAVEDNEKLQAQIQELEARIERKDAELAHKDNVILMAQSESQRARDEVHSYATSTSWKITAPLRSVINIFK